METTRPQIKAFSVASHESRRRVSSGSSALMRHLGGELTILNKVGWTLFPCIFFGVYMFLIVFRRTSFYMQGFGIKSGTLSNGPIYDVGSHIIMSALGLPDMSTPDPDPAVQQAHVQQVESIIGLTDTLMGIISAMMFVVPFASWYAAWSDRKIPKHAVYMANYFNRYVYVLILGHFMRFLSYTFTVVPGPSYHCRPEFVQAETGIAYTDLRPKNAWSIFFPNAQDLASISLNCGDLIFSGHMYTNVISYYYFVTYSKRIFTKPGNGLLSRRLRLVLIAADTACLVGTAITILASRQHYSVDIIIGTYIGLLLPHWYDQNLAPAEIDPFDDLAQAEELISTPNSDSPSPASSPDTSPSSVADRPLRDSLAHRSVQGELSDEIMSHEPEPVVVCSI
jgi:hypothetical protein